MTAPESSKMAENSRFRKPRSHSQNQKQPISETDPMPSIHQSTRSKSTNTNTISSILLSSFSPTNDHSTTSGGAAAAATPKKKNFTSATFRGMGCTASSQVSVPAVIRSSADWQESNKLKKKKKKNRASFSSFGANMASSANSSSINNNSLSSSCVSVPDVWCGPGIGFTTDAASVDCVVSRRPLSGRGKVDGERINTHREIVMLQSSLMMGGRSEGLSRFRDWRLDVDNMSYEELLELGDRIGYVSTGLKEEEIARCLRKTKQSVMDNLSSLILTETERKCSICQEEYEANDEMGELNCGHFYHIHCVKQWLLRKNSCPVCKTSALSQS